MQLETIEIETLIQDDLKDRKNKPQRERALRKYYENPNRCKYCNNIITVAKNEGVCNTRAKVFCNSYCASCHQRRWKKCRVCGRRISRDNKSGLCFSCIKSEKDEARIELWKKTGDTGRRFTSSMPECIREYIYAKQTNRCSICGIDAIWNGKELHLVLDHIDGDASNNKECNLRLICPNCDSQLDTYKSRNKHSARTGRNKK